MAIEVRLLREKDNRSSFQSGDDQLDLFFHRYAGQNQFRHHIGTTYIAVEREIILGFATVTVGHVEIENISRGLRKKLPDYPLPILRLARLAVDRNAQGKGVGEHLMRTVFSVAIELRDKVGCVGVVVDAKPAAENYYSRYGFVELEVIEGTLDERPAPKPMFLPLSAVIQALRTAGRRTPSS
ncbi:GNAT family N-acetyltransferase [Candidatus Binatus sp.]|uniref:GNAT family N-acetyltransferase n=1 Tax=Candidatus Binatus sp. TaxID=2811406 RepID=UPI003C587F3B